MNKGVQAEADQNDLTVKKIKRKRNKEAGNMIIADLIGNRIVNQK
jgi:hypothetical protein